MIVLLDIAVSALDNIELDLLEDRVSCLLRAHRGGHHLAIISRSSAKWLLQNISLIERDRNILIRIEQQITQTAGLLQQAPMYIQLVPPGSSFGTNEHNRAIQLPLDHPHFEHILRSVVLIVEDIDADRPVLDFMFRNFKSPQAKTPSHYEISHGGGEAILRAAKAKVNENRVVVVVSDSDRTSPVSSFSKSDKIDRLREEMNWPFFYAVLTPGAEIENCFGLEVLSRLPRVRSSSSYSALLKIDAKEDEIGTDTKEKFVWYFDLKKGVTETKLERTADLKVKNWLEMKLAHAGIDAPNRDLGGFGENLCKEVMTSDECLSEFRSTVRSKPWQDFFGDFVSHIKWILASAEPLRT